MTHPEDLLAEYVDGTLAETERSGVETHLAACERCREEVGLASGAVAALQVLPEEPVPFGVTGPVLAEARRRATPRQPLWARLQWAAGVAAAAALMLVAVVLLPQLTDRGAEEAGELRAPATEAGGDEVADGASLSALPGLEQLDQDLSEQDVARLARDVAKAVPSLPEDQGVAALGAPDEAVSCLVASGATIDDQSVLVRLIEASYLGTPAYFGVFHEGPGGGRPAERVVVWVVSSADCAILTLVSQNV